MRCEKHKRYKGVTPPKNKCPDCLRLYDAVTKESSKYYSLSTPNFKHSLTSVLAECITIMVYGPQPPWFWRKDTDCPHHIKKFFSSCLAELRAQDRDKSDDMAMIRRIFGMTAYTKRRSIVASQIYAKDQIEQETEARKKHDEVKIDANVINGFLSNKKQKRNVWELLSELEKKNGTKEEGR